MAGNTKIWSRRRPATYWLIVKREAEREERLILNPGSGETALAVFSFEEEAGMFLSLGSPGTGWRLKEATAEELTGILSGPCTDVRFVALDPLPELIGRGMIGLVNLRRERFVERLFENFSAPPLISASRA